MPMIASFSKLCGHFRDEIGFVMVTSVMGHLMLRRSRTAFTSSSSSEMGSASRTVGPRRRLRDAWAGERDGDAEADVDRAS